MDLYTRADNDAFVPDWTTRFDVTLPDGKSTTVIAVTALASTYWIVAYSVLVTVMFAGLGKLIIGAIMTFIQLHGRGNRSAILVAFYNSNSPTTAVLQMAYYLRKAIFKSRRGKLRAVNWDAVRIAGLLWLISSILICANLATKFLVSGDRLVAVRAARANPQAIFFPDPHDVQKDQRAYDRLNEYRVAAAYQALGRVQSAKKRLNASNSMVKTYHKVFDEGGEKHFSFNYSYSMNGTDWGLQHATDLTYSVKGSCKTDYRWMNTTDDARDSYTPWENPENMMPMEFNEAISPPFIYGIHNETNPELFYIYPLVAHRWSATPNTEDPWYLTEEQEPFIKQPYRVKRGRPGVICSQADTWAYKGQTTHDVKQLKSFTGLRMSNFIHDVLLYEFKATALLHMVNNLGVSSLESGSKYWPNVPGFNATMASSQKDFDRLVWTSFVYSREVIRNLVLFNPNYNDLGVRNLALANGSEVPYESADFMIESRDVAALRVSVLISIPCVCIFLWLLVWILEMYHGKLEGNGTELGSRNALRSIAFTAAQLYRLLDEEVSRGRRWSGRRTLTPYIKDIREDFGDEFNKEDEEKSLALGSTSVDKDSKTPQATSRSLRAYRYAEPVLEPVPETQAPPKRGFFGSFFGPPPKKYEIVMKSNMPPEQRTANAAINQPTVTTIGE